MRGRVGEWADGLEQLDDRARPAVRHDQRQRVLVRRLHVDEMDVQPVDLGLELRQRVQPRLAPAPVVIGRPVTGELLRRRQLHTLRPIGDEFPGRPARLANTPPQIVEHLVGDVDLERTDLGHRNLRSWWAGERRDLCSARTSREEVRLPATPRRIFHRRVRVCKGRAPVTAAAHAQCPLGRSYAGGTIATRVRQTSVREVRTDAPFGTSVRNARRNTPDLAIRRGLGAAKCSTNRSSCTSSLHAMTANRARHVEKYLWTDEDFDVMGWHDVKVWAVAFEPGDGTFESLSEERYYPIQQGARLLLDLDYIVEWMKPTPPQRYFGFWISPATLVFQNVQQIHGGELDLASDDLWLDIQDLVRSEPDRAGVREWTLDGHNFSLTISSTGFRQYLHQPPAFANGQVLSLDQRGGIRFAETTAADDTKD